MFNPSDNNKQHIAGFGTTTSNGNVSDEDQITKTDQYDLGFNITSNLSNIGVRLATKGGRSRCKSMSVRKTKTKKPRGKNKVVPVPQNEVLEEEVDDIPKKNTSYGLLVDPFASTKERVLGWSPEKQIGTCDRKGDFACLVWSRRYVLIFHELSMTGSPLSMMELATELMSCVATVFVVVLSKRGGLMQEITRRRIKVIEDTEKINFKAAMKADLVIVGSAVCASWIEQYHEQFRAGSSQIA